MFIFLLYVLLNMKIICSTVIIQNAGTYTIKNDDIAMVFFLTVENSFDHAIHASVCSIRCLEGDPFSESADHMFLLGGDMGMLPKKSTRNVTLIYPNLYLRNRVGKCLIALHYENDNALREIRKEVYFNSGDCYKPEGRDDVKCISFDLDGEEHCSPADCVIKYSSRRSFFNKEYRSCQAVPQCPPNTVYNPKSNTCRHLHTPVCKSDLEMIENGRYEKCHPMSNLVFGYCHHGVTDNFTKECVCDENWTTNSCREGPYHPTLSVYHMCNIAINSWGMANKQKLIMTILALLILALALAAKMLLAVCLLNWCCSMIRKRRRRKEEEAFCGDYECPYGFCGDEECAAGMKRRRTSKTARVSFSDINAESTDNETDISLSGTDSKHQSKSTRSTLGTCPCHPPETN